VKYRIYYREDWQDRQKVVTAKSASEAYETFKQTHSGTVVKQIQPTDATEITDTPIAPEVQIEDLGEVSIPDTVAVVVE